VAVIEYKTGNVLAAARRRMSQVFDDFENVVVSVSSGKDSTVIRHLAVEEAERRGRRCSIFFLDQEAEYQSSIDIITEWMRDPRTTPEWYQVPTLMTNATSHAEYWLRAWWHGETWLREKDPLAIGEIEGKYPQRFYDFFEWREKQCTRKTAFVVGLRARESFNRFRSVTKNPGHKDWCWTTKTKNPLAVRVYPIFEWTFGDVWKYITENGLRYNAHYDRMFAKYGINVSRMRVSNLIHEQAFRCLVDLQEFEPDTYERLIARLGGIHSAALYAKEGSIFDARALPPAFATWRAFRDYLLATTPIDKVERFRKRFAGQPEDDETCRRQCKQILINDWENNVAVANTKLRKLRSLWWDRL
jgi:predicted phosphoadenosine phosphosulfate sulfurtransferase